MPKSADIRSDTICTFLQVIKKIASQCTIGRKVGYKRPFEYSTYFSAALIRRSFIFCWGKVPMAIEYTTSGCKGGNGFYRNGFNGRRIQVKRSCCIQVQDGFQLQIIDIIGLLCCNHCCRIRGKLYFQFRCIQFRNGSGIYQGPCIFKLVPGQVKFGYRQVNLLFGQ